MPNSGGSEAAGIRRPSEPLRSGATSRPRCWSSTRACATRAASRSGRPRAAATSARARRRGSARRATRSCGSSAPGCSTAMATGRCWPWSVRRLAGGRDDARAVDAFAQALVLAERVSLSRSVLNAGPNLADCSPERRGAGGRRRSSRRALDQLDRQRHRGPGRARRPDRARRGRAAVGDRARRPCGWLVRRTMTCSSASRWRAELALRQGAPPAAEPWARRAVERVEARAR